MNIFNMPLSSIKGIGEKRMNEFSLLGINNVYDLLYYFPVRYQDRSEVLTTDLLEEGMEVCVKATLKNRITNLRVKSSMLISTGTLFDDGGEIGVIWYNNKFIAKSLKSGTEYIFFGKIVKDKNKLIMSNPVVENLKNQEAFTGKLLPVYKTSKALSQKVIQKAVISALEAGKELLPESLPKSVREKYELVNIKDAIENIHFPKNHQMAVKARRRFVFQELFLFQFNLYNIRQGEKKDGIRFENTSSKEFLDNLGFSYTIAQEKVSGQIKKDFSSGKRMKRLLQGDVGSGKTAVAFESAFISFLNGYQTALMAPTEILARQHFINAKKMMPQMKICLLTSSVKKKEKEEIYLKLKNGEYDFIIGTHTLIEPGVEFKKLGLVIADEQHRFGVRQRQRLIEKGENPHLLVMTATPIPRTLSIIMYGDLDVSVIDMLPPGRKEIKTYLVGESMHDRIYNFIKKQVSEGGQAYVVCPMVEESDVEFVRSATEYSAFLSKKLSPLRVAMLHGKMKEAEKNSVMDAFKEGLFDVLVSTTVIEVGVDVPRANLMVIENAERFGLSQLHQLRGRVGRGDKESFCVLFASTKNPEAISKLRVIESSTDGFYISEQDLMMRGPGDYFGTRQSGLPPIKNANPVSEVELLYKSKEAVELITNNTLVLTEEEIKVIALEIDKMYECENNCNIIN